MATKPTTVPTWATDANFTSGPASGHPTKVTPPGAPNVVQGSVSGEGACATFINWLHNLLCIWVGWVNSGSSAGAADAHLVETDASGDTVVRSVKATNGSYGITVSGTTGMQYRQGSVPDGDTNIEGTSADTHWCTTPVAQRDHDLLEASAASPLANGQRCIINRPGTGNFPIVIHREGVPGAMATLSSSRACSAQFEVRGGRWRLLVAGVDCIAGADA